MNKKIFKIIGLIGVSGWSLLANAYSSADIEVFANEPPLVRTMLEQATSLMASRAIKDAPWQAATLYCQAARHGSAEGLYRLGMLYTFGQGVPENLIYASSLFKTASMLGHFEAQKMLETIPAQSHQLPICVVDAVAPEKKIVTELADNTLEHVDIEKLIEQLPKNKRWLVDLVIKISNKYQVDPKLVLSIISVESNFSTIALSNKEAQGLMQLIPETAERFNVKNAYDASQNIRGGITYLRWLLSYFQGDVALALAGYNAGEGTVNKYKGIPPFYETREYVRKIQLRYPNKTHPYNENITEPSPILKYKLSKRKI